MKCPNCTNDTLELKKGNYIEGNYIIKNAEWEECSSCNKKYFGPKILKELTKAYYINNSIVYPKEIKSKRKLYNKKQKHLAAEVSVSEATVKRWEKGSYIPSLEKSSIIKSVFEKWERESYRELEADK